MPPSTFSSDSSIGAPAAWASATIASTTSRVW